MKDKLLTTILLAILLISVRPISAAQKRPLTEHDLVVLLMGGVYSSRIAALVEDRGITFVPTPAILESLREAGAQDSLEHAVAVAPKILPKVAQSNQKHSRDLRFPGPAPSQEALIFKHPTINSLGGQSRSPSKTQASIRLTSPNSRIASPQTAGSAAVPAYSQLSAWSEDIIPTGTKINIGNWLKYQRYMPFGMVDLFEGSHFWKMPRDIEIDVGPTIPYSLPEGYEEATRKYSDGVRVVHLSNGHNDIENYRGGVPFPNPQEPDKGYKFLADLWFAYIPHMVAGTARNPLSTCSQTSSGFVSCTRFSYIFRQLAYNTDSGAPTVETNGRNAWYSEWMSVEEPEQIRYTTLLTLYPKDSQQTKELYIFVPGLRRWIRGSLASRCSPIAGTDYAQDDYKREGFNGGIGAFDARFIGHQQILALTGDYAPLGGNFPANYYMPLGWPKPDWGAWQLRGVDVIDVRRIPAEQAGYCYGKRIMYEDSSTHYALWEDVYDTNMHFWKTALLAQRIVAADSLGSVPGGFDSSAWDQKNDHMTSTATQGQDGRDILIDNAVPKEYQNLVSYSTPAGLAEIMK
jgi:hypothetical protein